MSGSLFRRAVFGVFVVALLLPLASAWAVPVPAQEKGLQVRFAMDWSHEILQSMNNLLCFIRSATESANVGALPLPGGGGNDQGGEGNGIDPHGRP